MSMYSNKPTKIILIRNKNNNQQTTTNAMMGYLTKSCWQSVNVSKTVGLYTP